jgi:hypothetical protein
MTNNLYNNNPLLPWNATPAQEKAARKTEAYQEQQANKLKDLATKINNQTGAKNTTVEEVVGIKVGNNRPVTYTIKIPAIDKKTFDKLKEQNKELILQHNHSNILTISDVSSVEDFLKTPLVKAITEHNQGKAKTNDIVKL